MQTCVNYALKQLASVGVYQYMDAGHAGWLGWPANLTPAAQLFAQVFKDAGSSPFIKGLATSKLRTVLILARPGYSFAFLCRRCQLQRPLGCLA